MVEEQIELVLLREINNAVQDSSTKRQNLFQVAQAPVVAKKDTRYEEVYDIDIVDDWDYEDF